MEIYLVRHTSVDVPPGFNYGQTDVPLKPTFEEEAAAVKNNLKGLAFGKVWVSPLSRCVRLADYCGYPGARRENRIKEIHFGDWEMVSFDQLSSDPRSIPWFEDWVNVKPPGGESLKDQYGRVGEFLDEVRKSGFKRVCAFTHGGVLSCAAVYAGKYEIKEAFKRIPPYGSVMRLEFDD